MTMVSFQEYLKANNWRGTHVRKQMKRYAHAIRQSGGSYNKTYSQLAQSWTPDQWRYWIRDRRIKRVIQLYGHDDQRTDAWHAARSQMVTASEVCSVIDGTPSQRHEVMLRKLMPRSDGGRSQNLRNPLNCIRANCKAYLRTGNKVQNQGCVVCSTQNCRIPRRFARWYHSVR